MERTTGSISVYVVSAYKGGKRISCRLIYSARHTNKILRAVAGSFYDLPCPINLNM